MADDQELETREEAQAVGGEARYWQIQLQLAEEDQREWLKDGDAVVCRYKNERDRAAKANSRRFAMLYSNTETLKAAIYAKQAKPDVRRRYADQDPIGKQVAEIIERALIECSDDYASGEDADSAIESAIEDYLLPGRGVVRIKYEAVTAGPEDQQIIADQNVVEEYVYWKDFRHEPAQKWNKVTWVAFRHKMGRQALVENFGDIGRQAPLNWSPDTGHKKVEDSLKRAEVWEIWDKETKTRVWIVNGFDKVLRKDADPYRLQRFFPVAKPLLAVTTNDTLIPTPEFHIYKDQADSLDEIENRIDRLTRALRRRGVYDATVKELKRLAKAADNEFIPVQNYSELAQKGGLSKAFEAEDISTLAKVLAELHQQRDLRVQTIYEVTGISDILRGSSNPSETATAQQIKAQFGGARLKKRQDKVQKWIRDTLRIKAEIIAEHFEPQKLEAITGIPIPMVPEPPQPGQPSQPPAGVAIMKILRDDKLRSYRVDIETDSTVFEDAEAEKRARTELIQGVTEFLTAAVPLGAQIPPLMPLLFEILEFGLRGVKAGRTLEDAVEQTKQAVLQMAQQPKPPTPEEQKARLEAQMREREMQMKERESQQKLQFEAQKHQQEMEQGQQKFAQDLVLAKTKSEESIKMQREKAKSASISGGKSSSISGGKSAALAPVQDNSEVVEAIEQNGALMAQAMQMLAQSMNQLARAHAAPMNVIRDASGQIVGAQKATVQ
jgi:hypothetical protein